MKIQENIGNKIKVDITPDRSIYQKLGKGQHEIHDAIAEMIDNSFDARTKEQRTGKKPLNVTVRATFTVEGKYAKFLEIEDDAEGMDEDTAKNCLIIAKTSRKGDSLGRFGLGLKQSCLSIGKKFTITTKFKGGNKRYIINYDDDLFVNTGKWDEFYIQEIPDTSDWHGTIIRITDFWNKKALYKEKLTRVNKKFSWIFTPFIKKGELVLNVNNQVIEDEDLVNKCSEIYDIKIPLENKLEGGKEIIVWGWMGFLKSRGSTQGYSGFNLYRNMRLIRSWEHIGYRYHAETRLIVGELHMDDMPITIDKKDFLRDSQQWIELVGSESKKMTGYVGGKLTEFLKLRLSGHRQSVQSTRLATSQKRMEDKRRKELEEKKQLVIDLEKKKKLLEQKQEITTSLKEASKKLGGTSNTSFENKDELNKLEKEKSEILNKLTLTTFLDRKEININGKEYEFDQEIEHAGPLAPWFRHKLIGNKILIVTNLDYPLFIDLKKDIEVYSNIQIMLALAEQIVGIKNESRDQIYLYFNKLLDIYAKESDEKRRDNSKKSNSASAKKLEVDI
tara:strand:- start:1723 stop:3402 length:1680 start_codon:yes stop_codon:yes gene_type:complete